MNDNIQLFNNNDMGVSVRIVDRGGELWFVAKDVCDFLGTQTNNIPAILPEKDKGIYSIDTLGGPQEMTIISEPGMYKLVFRSRKPEAEAFTDWVTREVLPAIRKTGHYGLTDAVESAHKENQWLKNKISDMVKSECMLSNCLIEFQKTNKELQAIQNIVEYNKTLQKIVADMFDKNAKLNSEVKELTKKLNSRK